MSKAGTLRVNIVGDSGPLEKVLKGTSSKIGGFAKTVGKVGVGAIVALGGAAIGAAFKTAAMGDEIAKTAPKLGVSTDALQEMRYWAERNGVSSSDLERAVGRLNQRIGDGTAGSSRYVDALNGMGVATLDMNGEVRETGDVMADAIQALSAIESPAERSAAAAEIFGTKLARELMPALEDGSLSMEEAAAMAHELGLVMDEEAVRSAEKFTDAWADIKDAGMGMLRDFGTPVMEWMADTLFPIIQEQVVPALREFADWIGPHLSDAMDWISGVFNDVVIPAFLRLSEWWQENGPAIIERAQEIWAVLQDVFGRVGELIQTVAGWFQGSGGTMNTVMAEIRSVAADVWPRIQAIINSAMDAIRALIDRITAIAKGIWERWGDDILQFASTIWNAIKDVIDGVLDVIQGIWEMFAGLFSGDWERMWEGVKQIGEGIWSIIEGAWDALLGLLELAWTVFRDMLTEAWDRMWTAIKDKASEVWDGIKLLWDIFIGLVSGALDDFNANVRAIWDGLWTWASDLVSGIWDTIKGWWDTLTGGISSVLGSFDETTRGVWSSLWEWASGLVSGIWDTISGLWDTLVGTVLSLLGGFNDTIRSIWDALWNWVKEFVGSAWDDLKEAVSGGIGDVVAYMTGLPGRMLSALGDLSRILFNAGKAILDGLLAGIRASWENTRNFLSGLGGQIRNLKGPIEKDRVLLTDIGEEIIGGLGRGFESEWKQVEKMLGRMTADIPATVADGNRDGPGVGGVGPQQRQVVINIHGDVARELDEERIVELLNRSELLAGVR